MKENYFLSKNVFWENTVGYLRIGECQSFQACAIVFSTPGNLLVEISEALGTKESHFLSKNVYPENLLIEINGALGKKESHYLSENVFEKIQWGISEMVNTRAFKHLPLHSAPLKTY